MVHEQKSVAALYMAGRKDCSRQFSFPRQEASANSGYVLFSDKWAHALVTIQDMTWTTRCETELCLGMPYSEFEDSFGDTSYSDQLLRLDQTCERSHLDGWFCPSESFFCPSLVGILPSVPKACPILWVILALSMGSDPVVPQSSWQCLVSSLSSPVLSTRLRSRFFCLPNKPQHFTPTTSTRWPLSFFPTTIISILCLCVCTVLVSPALSSNCYSLLELCICLAWVHIPTARLAFRLWQQVFRRLDPPPHALLFLSVHCLKHVFLVSVQ